MEFRVGAGFDLHRLKAGRRLVLGCVEVPFCRGPWGHSDGDPVSHAIADAVLGAIGAGDIGEHFPPGDPRWEGAGGREILTEVVSQAAERGFEPVNVDVTLFLEQPLLGPKKEKMREELARVLGIPPSAVSVKAKSCEGFGSVGLGAAVAAQAAVLMKRAGAQQ